MPYAVTCRSCGARFSVADDLVHKKLSGKVVVLRCKQCHAPIRVNASEPPGRRSSRPPAPAARAPLPQGPARPKPRPPLKARPTGTVMGLGPQRPPPRNIVRGPEEEAKAEVSHDLFDVGPPSSGRYVDLSDMAHSEPPDAIASKASSANSSAPPLFDLAHAERVDLPRPSEDVDFLLGLTGSPGTAAALASPSLADLARKPPSEAPPSAPKERETPTPKAAVTTSAARAAADAPSPRKAPAAPPEKGKKGVGLGLALGLLGAIGVAAAALGLSQKHSESSAAPPPSVPPATPNEPESRPAPAEPLAAAPPTPTSSAEAEPQGSAAPLAVSSAPVLQPARATSPGVNANAKPARTENAPTEATVAPTATTTAAPPKAPVLPRPEPAAAGTPFDRNAAASALASAAAQASACRKDGDPSGVANVTLTFAPSGRVTAAKLSGPPFAGTATGGCIASTLRRAKIPPFDGEMVTVAKTIVVQ